MKIVIDSAIPYIIGIFEPYCSVEYIDGSNFTKSVVQDATALIIRTRTHCNRELLEGTTVRHIATATIGFDHIDTDYCRSHNIEVTRAAGCNARAVLQWFSAVMVELSQRQGWIPSERTLGVVGVGNVGLLVSQYAKLWGFNVICCDPPRQALEGGDFVSFEQLAAKADIITLHTPLDQSTHHLINAKTLKLISPNTTILNSSRGSVIDTEALLASGNPFVMDVWEGEPQINSQALERALIATPHIAGYSKQGKANASEMVVRDIARSLSLPLISWRSEIDSVTPGNISWNDLKKSIGQHFDIMELSGYLKMHKDQFESLRNNYNYRDDYF
ncbi:MAG: 4-phosphoerythronate dehydrogenase [Rikenellaceae bacterium]